MKLSDDIMTFLNIAGGRRTTQKGFLCFAGKIPSTDETGLHIYKRRLKQDLLPVIIPPGNTGHREISSL